MVITITTLKITIIHVFCGITGFCVRMCLSTQKPLLQERIKGLMQSSAQGHILYLWLFPQSLLDSFYDTA